MAIELYLKEVNYQKGIAEFISKEGIPYTIELIPGTNVSVLDLCFINTDEGEVLQLHTKTNENEDGMATASTACTASTSKSNEHRKQKDSNEEEDMAEMFQDSQDQVVHTLDSLDGKSDNEITMEEITSWTETATKLLISLYREFIPKVGKVKKFQSKKKMWIVISNIFKEKGYVFTEIQIENRWKTLERGFKNKTVNDKKTGRGRIVCSYEKELADIMIKKPAIFPDFTLASCGDGEQKEQLIKRAGFSKVAEVIDENIDNNNLDNNVEPSVEPIPPMKKFKVGSKKKEEKTKEEIINLEKSKLNAYMERNEILKKKNSLMEQLIASLNKD